MKLIDYHLSLKVVAMAINPDQLRINADGTRTYFTKGHVLTSHAINQYWACEKCGQGLSTAAIISDSYNECPLVKKVARGKCECGAAKVGVADGAVGHSDWCPARHFVEYL